MPGHKCNECNRMWAYFVCLNGSEYCSAVPLSCPSCVDEYTGTKWKYKWKYTDDDDDAHITIDGAW